MTRNQIEYLKYKESQRSNLRNEELTQRRDEVAKELGFGNLSESIRSHQAQERHNSLVLGEQQRHNLAQESYNVAVLGEQRRSNLVREGIEQNTLEENKRRNRAQESLQLRSQIEVERSNLARESETHRSNYVREQETERSNRAAEQNRLQQLELGYSQLAETSRYHEMSIGLGYSQLAESRRAAQAREAISLGELNERQRSNAANEALIKARDKMNYEESVRSHVAQEVELNRHQTAMEGIQMDANQIRYDELQERIRHQMAQESMDRVKTTTSSIDTAADTIWKLIPLFM